LLDDENVEIVEEESFVDEKMKAAMNLLLVEATEAQGQNGRR
jgi:hypothetical protein